MAEPSVGRWWPSRMSLPGSISPTYKAWCASATGAEEACFLLLKVADPEAARRWLQSAPVTSALKTDPPPETAVQVAFTRGSRSAGRSAGCRAWILGGVPGRYGCRREPFAAPRRHRRQCSVRVVCGRPPGLRRACLLMLYAREGGLEAWAEAVRGPIGMPGSASRPASTPSTWARSSRSASPTG